MSARLTIATAIDGPAAKAALTSSEATACARLRSGQRRDFRAGRLAAKRAAEADLRHPACCGIEIVDTGDGPPQVLVREAGGRIFEAQRELSLSHRDGHAVAVIAPRGMRVGVDLERLGSVQMAAVRDLLTPFEREIAEGLDPTVVWSVKEAAWKALGLGRSLPFADLELRADAHGRLIGVAVHGHFVTMHTRIAEPWPGYMVAKVWMPGGTA